MMRTLAAAFAAAFLLQACGAEQTPATSETTAAPAEAAAPPAAPEDGMPSNAALVGRWGDNGDCTKDVVFNADGSFTSYTGNSGRWSLGAGDALTMQGSGGTFNLRVRVVDENTLMIGNPDGTFGISQRC